MGQEVTFPTFTLQEEEAILDQQEGCAANTIAHMLRAQGTQETTYS